MAATTQKKPVYFDDPVIDKVLSIVLELAAEVHVVKDRLRIVEKLLEQKGQISREDVDRYQPTPDEQQEIRQERDEYIARLFRYITSDLE